MPCRHLQHDINTSAYTVRTVQPLRGAGPKFEGGQVGNTAGQSQSFRSMEHSQPPLLGMVLMAGHWHAVLHTIEGSCDGAAEQVQQQVMASRAAQHAARTGGNTKRAIATTTVPYTQVAIMAVLGTVCHFHGMYTARAARTEAVTCSVKVAHA